MRNANPVFDRAAEDETKRRRQPDMSKANEKDQGRHEIQTSRKAREQGVTTE